MQTNNNDTEVCVAEQQQLKIDAMQAFFYFDNHTSKFSFHNSEPLTRNGVQR